jgi:hypothetical protein
MIEHKGCLRSPSHAAHLRLLRPLRDAGHARLADLLDGLDHSVCVVQLLHVVAAADTLADNQYVRYGPSTSHIREDLLQLWADRVLVKFDHVRRGFDVVLFEEDVLCLSGVRAICFGEDDDWGALVETEGIGESAYLGSFSGLR